MKTAIKSATKNNNSENRVLVFMPTGRDAALVCSTLEKAGVKAQPCADADELTSEMAAGAGTILLAEEGLGSGTLEKIAESIDAQPVWSDLPIVLFAGGSQHIELLISTVATRLNATIIERPIRIPILISTVQGALRARQKQYQSRDFLNQLEEADRQKDLFLATLSHELRTPLNSILGWIQLLKVEDTGKKIDLRHALNVIERNARTQSEMISDILFVSRIITGKLKLNSKPLEVAAVVETTIEILRPALDAKKINLHTDFETNLPIIIGDADRLQQVFWNLLSNAIKFTPENGSIELRIKTENSIVQIQIKDSGQGISAEFLPYVFERFRQADSSYTRQIGGLGLGLAIVRHLVELHGGTVSAESAGENQGASFTVNLPVAAAESKLILEDENSPNKMGCNESNAPQTLRILLVEDDEDSREMLQTMFEQSGMKITGVSSAAEAVEIIQQIRFDVLISDIGLPNEDGYDLIGKIRQLPPEKGGLTPAIALTGYVSVQDRHHAFDVGFQEHLSKPVDIDELLELVKRLTDSEDKNSIEV